MLGNLSRERIEQFRQQVEVVDRTGQTGLAQLGDQARALAARSPGPFPAVVEASTERFEPLRPGGRREPLAYDPKGYFVIALDRPAGQSSSATTGRTTPLRTRCVDAGQSRCCSASSASSWSRS